MECSGRAAQARICAVIECFAFMQYSTQLLLDIVSGKAKGTEDSVSPHFQPPSKKFYWAPTFWCPTFLPAPFLNVVPIAKIFFEMVNLCVSRAA